MEKLLSYAVKEDILRTVLKKHKIIFLSGWSRTGKTISLLKSISDIQRRFYFSYSKDSQRIALSADSDIKILDSLSSFKESTDEETVIIIDDFSTSDQDTKERIIEFISQTHENLRIVLIVRAFIDVKNLIPLADALLRLKNTTAELLYSIWQERREDD